MTRSCSSSGAAKIARKGCDYLVINRVGWTEGFATERNSVDRRATGAAAIVVQGRGTEGRRS